MANELQEVTLKGFQPKFRRYMKYVDNLYLKDLCTTLTVLIRFTNSGLTMIL